jgi:hypothetical protein
VKQSRGKKSSILRQRTGKNEKNRSKEGGGDGVERGGGAVSKRNKKVEMSKT